MIDLRKLDAAAGNVTSEQEVRLEDEFGEATVGKCVVNVSFQHTGGTYYFHGEVKTTLDASCHRCLEPVRYPLSGEFDVVVRRRGQVDEGDADASGEFIMLAVGENEVSFDELINESVVVNIPMLIVCRDDCRGLCPRCGTNLNNESCSCDVESDTRWDALRRLGSKNAEE